MAKDFHIDSCCVPTRENSLKNSSEPQKQITPLTTSPKGEMVKIPADDQDVEEALFWRPTPQRPIAERLYRIADGMLGLKELEFLGEARQGPVPERITSRIMLSRIKAFCGDTTGFEKRGSGNC